MSKITIKTPEEIKILREGGKILAKILKKVSQAVKPGVSTLELDSLARKLMAKYGVKPSFEGFGSPPYPAALCTSVNDGLVHCIPSNEIILKSGDIISLDCGIWHKDLCTDHAVTVAVGHISSETKKLLEVTKKSLELGIKQVKPGNKIGDIGQAVQDYVENQGFGVVRKLVGHGVGYEVHEPPKIPNFGKAGHGEVIEEGMVLAIEPMVSVGDYDIKVGPNEWDILMKDGSLSAHYEHTVAVTKHGSIIITK